MRKRLAKKIVKGRFIYCDYKGRIPYWLDKWDERYVNSHFHKGYDRRLEDAARMFNEFPHFRTKAETKNRVKHILWKLRNKKQTLL